MPRCIEKNVDWVTSLIGHMAERGHTTVAPTFEAQEAWVAEVVEGVDRMLFSKVSSWFTGRHRAGSDDTPRNSLIYVGGFPAFTERCAEEADAGYPNLMFR